MYPLLSNYGTEHCQWSFFSLKSIPKPVELTVLPRGWKPWDHSNPFELVNLDPREKEYIEVEEDFHQTLDRQEQAIERIYRVQNPALWSAFCQ